jgi:hypothetical protein
MTAEISNFTGLISIALSVLTLIVVFTRSQHQNSADDGAFVKNMAEAANITTAARLEAERTKLLLEKRVTDLERLLNNMAYRVTFVVHTGEEPRIEKISVERFSDHRIDDVGRVTERRHAAGEVGKKL